MIKFFNTIGLILFGMSVMGQVNFEDKTTAFLHDLNTGDSVKILSYFHPEAVLYHVTDGKVEELSIEGFMTVAPKFKSGKFQEEFTKVEVKDYHNGLVYTDVYFNFIIDGKFSHSGVDHCVWVNKGNGYKIETLYSSVLMPTIKAAEEKSVLSTELLNALVDAWHKNASETNFEAYFGFMAEGFIFLGTDPKERWSKDEFAEYCSPYFERGKAWTFTKNWRNWYFNEDSTVAWFEESLATQMDECRGSGVLTLIGGEWKIQHYNLTVLIENEKMKKFLKLRKK